MSLLHNVLLSVLPAAGCLPQMVCMLVRAGADVNACCKSSSGSPAIAHALLYSKQQEEDAEILQILIGEGCANHFVARTCLWDYSVLLEPQNISTTPLTAHGKQP
jgi:hypothetical protein